MRRKLTSLVLPPVAMTTAFFARRFTVASALSILPSERKLRSGAVAPDMILGVCCAVMPITRPDLFSPESSRIRLVIL
jgi:hypothetical protein